MSWRGVVVGGVALGVLLVPGQAGAVEGCVAANPSTVNPNPCTYAATLPGEYWAGGDWTLTIQRGDTVLMRSSSAGDVPVDVAAPIQAGDVVTIHAETPGSFIGAGSTRSFVEAGAPGCVVAAGYDSGGEAGTAFPDDPLFSRQWSLRQLEVPAAWDGGAAGDGVTVAVIDTGIDLNHPDLSAKLVPGVDLVEGHPDQPADCPTGPQDEDSHGTAVAGVIAAESDNGIGIAGVAPLAKLMPIRVRDQVESLDFSHVGDGIRFAVDHGARVISLTGGVTVPIRPSPVLEEDIAEALAYAWSKGVVTVATAGNNRAPWCQYPASSENVVCAAATDRDGQPTAYSQFPLKASPGAAVRAPGGGRTEGCESEEDVWTTILPASGRDCGPSFRGYDTDSGTTYATAHTAGVAALLAGRGLTNAEIVECLKATSSNRGTYDPIMGYGIVNADRAVATCRASLLQPAL